MTKSILFLERAEELRRIAKDVPRTDWRKRLNDLATQYEEIARNYAAKSTINAPA